MSSAFSSRPIAQLTLSPITDSIATPAINPPTATLNGPYTWAQRPPMGPGTIKGSANNVVPRLATHLVVPRSEWDPVSGRQPRGVLEDREEQKGWVLGWW